MNPIQRVSVLSALAISCAFTLTACQKNEDQKPQVVQEEQVTTPEIQLNGQNMMAHLQAFQKIADENQNNRATGTAGGLASGEYILEQIKKTGYRAEVQTFKNRDDVVGQNIIVKMQGESSNHPIIIVGAHYDSVESGAGINDNASGVALLLELIQQLKQSKTKLKSTIYFAFWDSEEVGIAGSQAFVKSLSHEQLKNIEAYINVDMVGTKDPTMQVIDADKSSINEMEKMLKELGVKKEEYTSLLEGLRAIPSHSGDVALENSLKAFAKEQNVVIKEDISIITASDTAAFIGKVPVTSITFFNEKLNGDELEFAPCYHKECDKIDIVDTNSLTLAGKAVLHLIQDLQK